MSRQADNLAVSLEEVCSLHADISDHEIELVFPSPYEKFADGIENSATLQEMRMETEPNFFTSTISELDLGQNHTQKLGKLIDLMKRHSIGSVDCYKILPGRPAHAMITVPPMSKSDLL